MDKTAYKDRLRHYFRSPVLWLSLMYLLMSFLFNYDAMHASSANPAKPLYGLMYLTSGILGVACNMMFSSLSLRIAELERKCKEAGISTAK